MKDGRTHLAYKAEHVVDLESDLVLGGEIHPGDRADTETLVDSVMEAQVNLKQAGSAQEIEEVAADKGYHAAGTLELCESLGPADLHSRARSRHRAKWTDKPPELQRAVYGIGGACGAPRASVCSGGAANSVSGPSPTSATPAACGAVGSAGWRTSPSAT